MFVELLFCHKEMRCVLRHKRGSLYLYFVGLCDETDAVSTVWWESKEVVGQEPARPEHPKHAAFHYFNGTKSGIIGSVFSRRAKEADLFYFLGLFQLSGWLVRCHQLFTAICLYLLSTHRPAPTLRRLATKYQDEVCIWKNNWFNPNKKKSITKTIFFSCSSYTNLGTVTYWINYI